MSITTHRPAAPAVPEPPQLQRHLDAALAALAALGTPGAIAEQLHRDGHTGEPGCAFTCAIADYLRAHIPGAGHITVALDAGATVSARGGHVARAQLPMPVWTFVREFDRGMHQQLRRQHQCRWCARL